MNLNELHDALIEQTNVDPEKVAIKNDAKGKFIFLDDFIIRDNGKGGFHVSDTREELEPFDENGDNVVSFFTGFFDGFVHDDLQVEGNEHYENGFDFCLDCMENDEEEEGEEEGEEEEEEEAEEN